MFHTLTGGGELTGVFGRSVNPGGGIVIVCVLVVSVFDRVGGVYGRDDDRTENNVLVKMKNGRHFLI